VLNIPNSHSTWVHSKFILLFSATKQYTQIVEGQNFEDGIYNCRHCFCIASAFMPGGCMNKNPLGFSQSPINETHSAKANTIILN
jgi:hypothetical protein